MSASLHELSGHHRRGTATAQSSETAITQESMVYSMNFFLLPLNRSSTRNPAAVGRVHKTCINSFAHRLTALMRLVEESMD